MKALLTIFSFSKPKPIQLKEAWDSYQTQYSETVSSENALSTEIIHTADFRAPLKQICIFWLPAPNYL